MQGKSLPNYTRAPGEIVQYLRKLRRMSQEELGEKAHLHRVQVSRVERGQQEVTPELANRLADALDTSPSGILTGDLGLTRQLQTLMRSTAKARSHYAAVVSRVDDQQVHIGKIREGVGGDVDILVRNFDLLGADLAMVHHTARQSLELADGLLNDVETNRYGFLDMLEISALNAEVSEFRSVLADMLRRFEEHLRWAHTEQQRWRSRNGSGAGTSEEGGRVAADSRAHRTHGRERTGEHVPESRSDAASPAERRALALAGRLAPMVGEESFDQLCSLVERFVMIILKPDNFESMVRAALETLVGKPSAMVKDDDTKEG